MREEQPSQPLPAVWVFLAFCLLAVGPRGMAGASDRAIGFLSVSYISKGRSPGLLGGTHTLSGSWSPRWKEFSPQRGSDLLMDLNFFFSPSVSPPTNRVPHLF